MSFHCTVGSEKCVGCGTCIPVCPKRLLILEDGRPRMIEGREHLCNDCGQCTAYCPEGAIIHNGIRADELERTTIPTSSASKTVLQALKQRRSYRNFSTQPVKQSDLEKILEVVGYAPSGGNNRFLRLIITKPETTKKFLELIAQWLDGDCRTDPVYGKRYASKIDSILERYRAGQDPILRNAPSVVFSVGPKTAVWGGVESGINLTYFNLAAETMNIGCCFAGYATAAAKRSREVRELLGIKEDEECFSAMCFGYKTIRAQRIPARSSPRCEIL